MKAYKYNSVTKEYTVETECQLDPLETKKQGKNIYLLPAGSTLIKPSEIVENKIQVLENDKWIEKDNYRNIVYYDKITKRQKFLTEIDILPDDNWTELEPLAVKDTCKWDKTKWIIDTIKVAELEKIKQKEILVQDKIIELAIEALKSDGKLDSNGELI